MASHPANAKYPDTVAVTYDETNHKVTCVYSDRSLYLWDVRDIRKVRHCHHKSLPMFFFFGEKMLIFGHSGRRCRRFRRWESRIRSCTTRPAFGVWSRIRRSRKE